MDNNYIDKGTAEHHLKLLVATIDQEAWDIVEASIKDTNNGRFALRIFATKRQGELFD